MTQDHPHRPPTTPHHHHSIISGWSESPTPFPDGVVSLPEPPKLDPESAEAKRLCVPGTGWRHRLLLVSASCVGFGGYFARNILSAVSPDVRGGSALVHCGHMLAGIDRMHGVQGLTSLQRN